MLVLNLLIIIRMMNAIKLSVKCPHLIFANERKEKKVTISYNEQRCKYIKTRSDIQYIF